jgi:hypothetical protein
MVVTIRHNQIFILIDNDAAAVVAAAADDDDDDDDDDDNIVNINILQNKLSGRRVVESKSNYQRAI